MGFGTGPFGGGPFGGLVPVAVNATPINKKSGQGPFIPPGAQLIPLTNSPNQTLTVSLNIDGKVQDYFLQLQYNEIAGYWTLTLNDSNGDLILDSVPFVTGEVPAGNILRQYAYLGIGSAFILSASSLSTQDYPGMVSLGTDFVLVWGNTPVS